MSFIAVIAGALICVKLDEKQRRQSYIDHLGFNQEDSEQFSGVELRKLSEKKRQHELDNKFKEIINDER